MPDMTNDQAAAELESLAAHMQMDPVRAEAMHMAIEALSHPLKAFAKVEIPFRLDRFHGLSKDAIDSIAGAIAERLDGEGYDPMFDYAGFDAWLAEQIKDPNVIGGNQNA